MARDVGVVSEQFGLETVRCRTLWEPCAVGIGRSLWGGVEPAEQPGDVGPGIETRIVRSGALEEVFAIGFDKAHRCLRGEPWDIAKRRMPQDVIVMGVGGEARKGAQAAFVELGGDVVELIDLPSRIDEHRLADRGEHNAIE